MSSYIIGFSSDTCNVMFGERLSVMSLMKEVCNNIVFVKCSCYMIHLCVSHACLKLSTILENLCRNIFNYFSRSSLLQHELKEFQMFQSDSQTSFKCFNTLFQPDQTLLHALHEKACQLLKELMSDFVKLDVIRNCDVLTLNARSKLVQVSTVDVYVGINATKTLKIVCGDKDAGLKFKTT